MGNPAQHEGYGCQMPAMVDLWRREWSKVNGTTDPQAPFGIVTLASGGSEGGSDIGGMRFSQTANYGSLPNAAMPSTFLAQAYDLVSAAARDGCTNVLHQCAPLTLRLLPSCPRLHHRETRSETRRATAGAAAELHAEV